MVDRKVLRIVKGSIAMRGILKKNLAKVCGISPSQLSLYLHGDMPIPYTVYEILVRELNLAGTLAAIGTRKATNG
jgi:transcriptional regulator with XRE-family HTH domain